MTSDDDEATPEELEEAARLARALERGHAPAGAPEDALATAGLLRFAKDGGALDGDESRRILDTALASARPRRTAIQRRRFTFLGLLGLAAAGTASFVFVVKNRAPEPEAALPAPPRALLEAQVAAASGPTASLDALALETAQYRGAVFAKLRERYAK
jgi:hypothetical protein